MLNDIVARNEHEIFWNPINLNSLTMDKPLKLKCYIAVIVLFAPLTSISV